MLILRQQSASFLFAATIPFFLCVILSLFLSFSLSSALSAALMANQYLLSEQETIYTQLD